MKLKKNLPSTLLIVSLLFGSMLIGAHGSQQEAAAALWKEHCVSCHGDDGTGRTRAGRQARVVNLTSEEQQKEYENETEFRARMRKNLLEGIQDGNRQRKKSFRDELSEKEIKALADFVLQRFREN